MKLSSFITKTRSKERGDRFDLCYKSAYGFCDEVVIIDGRDTWPTEFSWDLIGQHFQRGYEQATGDWVIHLDADFIIHENDYKRIRKVLENCTAPAMTFYKYQFIVPHEYNLKSRLVVAVNKKTFGSRIAFNSGKDLCQPSLDGEELRPEDVPESGIAFWNYEKLWKTEAQIKDDVERMARAWTRYFKNTTLGDTETAYSEWLKMVIGRYQNKPQTPVSLSDHPKIMQSELFFKPEQFGYNGLNNFMENAYHAQYLSCHR